MAAGRTIGCFGLTEPDFGSNPSGMLTTAVRAGKGYKLNGTKRWITNGSIAHVALVWAKLDGKVRGFLVPTKTPGFTARDIHGKWSLRASVTSELILEDVEVGEDALLPGVSGLRATRETISASSSISTGLETKPSMPQARQRSRASTMALAVRATIVVRSPGVSRRRISSVAAKPSSSGIWQSIRIRSYRLRPCASSASRPVETTSAA